MRKRGEGDKNHVRVCVFGGFGDFFFVFGRMSTPGDGEKVSVSVTIERICGADAFALLLSSFLLEIDCLAQPAAVTVRII